MSDARWAQIAESGSLRALRFGAWLVTRLGRRASLLVLWLPALYFALRNRHAREGSLQYLEHVAALPEGRRALARSLAPGRSVSTGLVIRHIYEFAVSLYDRFLLWGGVFDPQSVERDRPELFAEVMSRGKGALLFGAHLGSHDMLWLLARELDVAVNVVAFFANAERINRFLEAQGAGPQPRVIELEPGSVQAAFEIRACLERGELVVMLVDRLPPGRGARLVEVPFLGEPAQFALGPFLLAGSLGCPVLMAVCPRSQDARYAGRLLELSAGVRPPRHEREKAAQQLLTRYVGQLEKLCLEFPLQWFNYYRFWDRGAEEGVGR